MKVFEHAIVLTFDIRTGQPEFLLLKDDKIISRDCDFNFHNDISNLLNKYLMYPPYWIITEPYTFFIDYNNNNIHLIYRFKVEPGHETLNGSYWCKDVNIVTDELTKKIIIMGIQNV